MDSEVAKLQEELKAAIAAEAAPKRIKFKNHSPEGDLVTCTIRGMLSDIEQMNKTRSPFLERIKKSKRIFNYIMANPNIVANSTLLRTASIKKAKEFLEPSGHLKEEYIVYNESEEIHIFKNTLRQFLAWTEEILPLNVHYVENICTTH
jgi:hypothetical protein